VIVYHVEDLYKSYPRQAVPANRALTFEVHEGEIFGILGDNGAGKSTLVRQMSNLLRSTSGSIRLFGEPITQRPQRVALTVGYMPQQTGALNHLTVGEALYYTAHLRGLSRTDASREREQLLEQWRIPSLRNKDSAGLSGGEQRILRLAVAMAGALPVLILDEPTNDLDPVMRRLVWDNLRALNSERGTTIIFITHDAVEAERVIQRVGIMHEGQMVAIGKPAALKQQLGKDLRVELRFPPDRPPRIPDAVHCKQRAPDHWVLSVPTSTLPALLASLDHDALDDLRVTSPTLEDLYFHYVDPA
jgi:ABC-2 type transport system ATP-binding protein